MGSELEQEVIRAQAGDREAFIRLLREVESSLYTLARAIVKQDEDSADAIQETMLKAFKSLHTLRSPEYFKTWIIRILVNECNRIIKMRARTVAVAEFPDLCAVTKDYENIDLREAIHRLDDTLRIVIVLHYLDDIPLKQVAEILDISEGAVKNRLHRARKILLDLLQNPVERKIGYEMC